jgi:hypothetical protein
VVHYYARAYFLPARKHGVVITAYKLLPGIILRHVETAVFFVSGKEFAILDTD